MATSDSQRYCSKCRRTFSSVNFYTYKNGSKCELCKNCLTMHIDTYDEGSFLWLMEKFDVPYIPAEWKARREKEFEKAYAKAATAGSKDPTNAAYGMTKGNGVVWGKYLSQMKLKQWKNFTWADTERLKIEAEEKARLYGTPDEQMKEKIEEMQKAFERGEISEAQWRTYNDINPELERVKSLEDKFLEGGGPNIFSPGETAASPYPVNDNPFEKVDIPDVGNELTDEDKIYLAMKWGRLYTASDWVWLEQKYNDFMNSFDIQGAARIDTLTFICKTSLKMNQALDSGDIDSYQKLSRVYDAQMKAAKFTEAQNKDSDSTEFDSVGSIVAFCEKEGGFIPEYEIKADLDIVDTIIRDNKEYLQTLIHNDTNLSQQIEQFLKKKEIAEEQKRDRQKAKEEGLSSVEITDKDHEDFYKTIEKDKEQDKKLYIVLDNEEDK